MKVTFKTATLRYLLRVTLRTVGKDGASITSHVMLTAAGETLTAMTTDNIAGTSIAATAQVAEDGAICLPGKKLQEIVTKLPEYGDATITADTKRWKATISCGNYRGTISGMDPTFMPRSATMEDLDEANSQIIKIQTKGLDRVIKQVGTFVQDEKRYQDINLTGVLVTFNNSAVTMMSCDGSRLCVRTIPVTGDLPDSTLQLIMPRKQLNEFANILDESDEAEIGVTPTANRMIFRVKPKYTYHGVKYVEIASLLLAGPYPDLRRIIPTQSATRVVIKREELAAALRLANVLANKYHHVLIEVDPPEQKDKNGVMTVSAKNPLDGDSEQTLSVKVQGAATEIWFNGEYLLEWVDLVTEDTIVLDSLSSRHPALFYPNGVDARTYFYVCMPMSVDEEEEGEGEAAKPEAKSKGKGKKGKAAATAEPAAEAEAAQPAEPAAEPPAELTYVADDEDGYDPTYELEAEAA
ncbi:MAG: DNA polymerase III subunit beta [Caldilineaceae bacterium]